MTGIGLVLNARAKRHQRNPELAGRLSRILGDDGVVRAPESYAQLSEIADEFRQLGIELVAVAGGDGTNHITISGVVEAYHGAKLPHFALLRGGTMNTTANSIGIPRRGPETLLTRYVEAYRRRMVTPMRFVEPNVLRVGDHYGFIFGTGAIYGFIAEYNTREDRSPLWAAQVLGGAIATSAFGTGVSQRVSQRWRGTVRFADGTAFPERDYFTIGASTCAQIGLGFKPFYRSGERPDCFHMLGIHCGTVTFVRSLPRVWAGDTLGGDKTYEKVCEHAVLEPTPDEDGIGVVPYTLDGDVYRHAGPLEVACGPRLRIIVP